MTFTLKTEVESFSETFVPMYQSTERHIPSEGTFIMLHIYIPYIPGPNQPHTMCTKSFPGGKWAGSVALTTHPCLAPRLKKE